MSFIDDYHNTLEKAIENQMFPEARKLVQSFHLTGIPYDARAYYLEASLCYYEAHYSLASLYARIGFEKFPDYYPFRELLTILAKEGQEFDDYLPNPTFDCTCANRKLHIVLYENVLPIMDYTAEQFRLSFELLGHDVFVFHHTDFENSSKALLEYAKNGIDFVLLFNNIGSLITTQNGQNIWEVLNVVCFDYLFDHPLYYPDDMKQLPSHAIVTCVDRNHVKFLHRFYPTLKDAFYFPLGGEYVPVFPTLSWSERPIDVLYVGSLKTVKDAPENKLSSLITQYLLTHTECTTEDAFELCLQAILASNPKLYGRPLTVEDIEMLTQNFDITQIPLCHDQISVPIPRELFQDILYKYRYVDMHVNSYFRQKMISVLVKNGVHVTVYGHGWEQTDFFHNPCFHYGGVVSQTECLEKISQTKIILNSMPWFKDGAHDRIFNAMLSHAVCVTDESTYLKENFEDKKEIIYYRLQEIDKLPEIVNALLQNPVLASQIAENGFQKAILSHSWENRALELLTRYFQSAL